MRLKIWLLVQATPDQVLLFLQNNLESLLTHPEEEGYTEDELMNVTVEASVEETKYVKEDAYEGETKVDEVVGTFIRIRQSYYWLSDRGCHIIWIYEAVLGFKVSELKILLLLEGDSNKG